MDLGIRGRKAIVCASSKGLGRGVAIALAREGVDLVINGRNREVLEATATAIRAESKVNVIAITADVTTEVGRNAVLAACPDPDILINNAGGPPPGDFRNVDRDGWLEAIDANMLTPIFLAKATIDRMIARRFGRIINITSAGVKAPGALPTLAISVGARAGLTGFMGVLSRQVAQHNVTINGVLPGRFDTDRLRSVIDHESKATGRPASDIATGQETAIPARRFGTVEEFGAITAFLCSGHAGYITGQNLMLDGGMFPGFA
ncbi:MAG: SDR family oxidoreductase [Burkholderiales bacterium]